MGKAWRLYNHGIGGSDALMKARIRLEVSVSKCSPQPVLVLVLVRVLYVGTLADVL